MTDLISYFQTSDNAFWGSDVYRWWFYLSILLIIILEKRKMVKRVYGIYPIIFFIVLFNPITYEVTKYFSGGIWQYYARLYSMLPVPYTLALGTILIIDFVSGRKKRDSSESSTGIQTWHTLVKFNLSIGVFVLIVFGGTSVYSQYWMQPAQNIAKVPDEALWICKALHQDEGVTIAVPDSLSSYIRQIDASIYMPYGRYVNELGYAISQEHPDPEYVMKEAGKEACDYIVIYDNEENRKKFSDYGCKPEKCIGRYLVYYVEGVSQIKKEYDKQHRVISVTFLDENGKPSSEGRGYSRILYKYDSVNNQSINVSYYDTKEELAKVQGRFSTKYEYDRKGQIRRESYYNLDGFPMMRTDLMFGSREITYDDYQYVTGERYYDLSGRLELTVLGYAFYTCERNQNHQIIGETYFDEEETVIGRVSHDIPEIEHDFFRFLHCSNGVTISKQRNYIFTTNIPNNRFNLVHFQIYDAESGEYLSSFGESYEKNEIEGLFHFEFPTGLYKIVLKGNTNLSDEYISCYEYIENESVIQYSYSLDEITNNKISISNVHVRTQ